MEGFRDGEESGVEVVVRCLRGEDLESLGVGYHFIYCIFLG